MRSLQGRLLAGVLALVVAVWLATAALTWFDARHEIDELLDGHLAQAAALLVVQQSHEAGEDHQELDTPTLHRYAPKVAFQVFHEGRLALRSANAPDAAMGAFGVGSASAFSTVSVGGKLWRVFAARGAEADVQVFVGEQVDSRLAIGWAVLRSTLWPMGGALPLLALAVWWAVRRGTAPLRQLGRTLAARDPQALQPVTVATAPSEMEPLLAALNSLFQRISALMAAERRFTDDAAHELRTPIAAIRAQAQVALGATEDGERRHALAATLAGCDRATRLVEQMLTLARLEAGAAALREPFALAETLRQAVAELAPQALARQQTIALDAPDTHAVMQGDATLMAVLVRNLVDNALRYSPPGAGIAVTLRTDAAGRHLSVEDSGPGVPEAERRRLGERFFRIAGSEQPGSGLGLSIVQRIVAMQGGALRLAASPGLGGLAVHVDWPAAGAGPDGPWHTVG